MSDIDEHRKELNPGLVPKPALCLLCEKEDRVNSDERFRCNRTRLDEYGSEEFVCRDYEPKGTRPRTTLNLQNG